ncbi:MAG: DNA repair protein RecN [Deltaproteobacteria bacterium]|nr:MAG: DNA repair protein RecN [Deltaproteobacteria bacterium]
MGTGVIRVMLVHLSISDFAIIKHLDITLGTGLNILSGETGAGKTIIIHAVNLILGGRASAEMIRSGCGEARVEALFSFPADCFLKQVLADQGIPFDGDLLVRRILLREGKNRIFINGAMATLQLLSRLGALLVSISGQHAHQLLLKPEHHLSLLDDFGGLSGERERLGQVFGRYRSAADKVRDLEAEIREMTGRQELARFQMDEIDGAEIRPGEDTVLSEEKTRLRHGRELLEIVREGYQVLYERQDSVLSSVSRCGRRMEKGMVMDRRLSSIREALNDLEAKLEDIAFSLRDFQKTVRVDPHRLEQVEERLSLLKGLKRKYGPTLEDVLRFRENLASAMDDLDGKKERLGRLRKERDALETEVLGRASALSEKRRAAARVLERAMEKELGQLHMKHTRFQVRFEPFPGASGETGASGIGGVRADGIDRVEFMISPNMGEALRPLSRVASGGELSRVMLAARSILAGKASVETLIFDEVDSGISGATAEVVGEKLHRLGRYHQILCITHLPQIASQGETHFLVKKDVVGGRTQTRLVVLEPGDRVREIARLLAGRTITPRTVATAREMLGLPAS